MLNTTSGSYTTTARACRRTTRRDEWYRKAAEQGYADAQFSLGSMYDNGRGVSHDYVIAHMWLSLAAGGDKKGAEARNKMTPRRREISSPIT